MTPKRQSAEIARLRRELAKAQADQEILKAALESAGKAHALLEKLAESAEPDPLKPKFERPQSPNSSPAIGLKTSDACAVMGVSRATLYRRQNLPARVTDPIPQKDRAR